MPSNNKQFTNKYCTRTVLYTLVKRVSSRPSSPASASPPSSSSSPKQIKQTRDQISHICRRLNPATHPSIHPSIHPNAIIPAALHPRPRTTIHDPREAVATKNHRSRVNTRASGRAPDRLTISYPYLLTPPTNVPTLPPPPCLLCPCVRASRLSSRDQVDCRYLPAWTPWSSCSSAHAMGRCASLTEQTRSDRPAFATGAHVLRVSSVGCRPFRETRRA
ncbi:hypothetical protein JOL62DRAFT_580490 [Phyllosticta paracitricarpa]|uniref:Uncharacterized protein n=1 Tax=Phyllosticta paracitricarpa TaxID=2016321 RepID=A0ABR1N3Y8_9PEZI